MADRLWQCHGPAPVAAVEELQSDDDNGDVVAAIPDKKQFQRKKGGHFKGQRARRSCHWAAGCHVPRSTPRAGQGEEEAVLGDRCHLTWVSVDRLKPHVGAKIPKAAQPPTCGRPRKKAP